MKKMYRSSFIALISIVAVLVLLPSAQAVDFKISGQINRGILWGDNGNDSDLKFVDNDNSSTRFRFTGSNDFEKNFSVGIVWENQM
jgi:predicted porin